MTKPPSPPYLGPANHAGAANNKPIHRVVIHATVSPCEKGGARNIARYFRTTSNYASAHYVVDPGEVVQVVYDSVTAYHAPPNQHSIGVELCDPMKGPGSRWSDAAHGAMLERAAELVAQLCLAYDVPIRKVSGGQLKGGKRGICGHADVRDAWGQTTHYDPGEAFPWDRFMAMVHAAANPTPARKDPSRGRNINHAVNDLTAAAKANRDKPVRFRRIKAALAHLTKIKAR